MHSTTIEPSAFRSVMGKFATGVTVVSYEGDDGPTGLTANAFMSVSIDPPLVLVSVRKQSRFLANLAIGGRYGISFLAHNQRPISDCFGGRPGTPGPPEFDTARGVPLVRDCLATIVAEAVDIHPAGDHMLVIGKVEQLEERALAPLLYFGGQYQRLHETA